MTGGLHFAAAGVHGQLKVRGGLCMRALQALSAQAGILTAVISSITALLSLYLGHRFKLIASSEERRAERQLRVEEKNVELRIKEVEGQDVLRKGIVHDNERLKAENTALRDELEESAKLRRKLGEALEQASRDRLTWESERLEWYQKERTWERLVSEFHAERAEWCIERDQMKERIGHLEEMLKHNNITE